MRSLCRLSWFALLLAPALSARELEPKPPEAALVPYEGWLAPRPVGPVLQPGDRLAICGDSITEQKMYSVMLEAYLTACVPELGVTCRQYGWSGEQASGFANRMRNDVLHFQPTVATTCYGMNDHRYVPYTEEIGRAYRENLLRVVRTFKEAGVRVVVGSPGTIGKVPHWVKTASGTAQDLNLSLCRLRNIGIEIAEAERVGFADIFWPMLLGGHVAQKRYGPGFMLCGQDGVHPGWAGQAAMATSFLRAFGLDGDLGGVDVDLAARTAVGRGGHEAEWKDGAVAVRSARWPFVVPEGDLARDDQMAAGVALVGFHEHCNRFTLRVAGLGALRARVTWGSEAREFTAEALAQGVNLAAHFPRSPFREPFEKLMEAVKTKQAYETRQIKELFHGREGRADMEATAALTEKARAPLAAAVVRAFHPVAHALQVEPLP
jgi:lysophospholipase L1-like esterase